MAITLEVGDPVVYWQVLGQPYAATVVTTDSGDPPVLKLAVGARQFPAVHYNANGQAANSWCLYTDPGRPGTLNDPDQSVSTPVYMTQADADARYLTPAAAAALYLTQAQADDLYAPITP